MKNYSTQLKTLFLKISLLVLTVSLLSSCHEKKNSYFLKLKIKIMTETGKVLTGYGIYRGKSIIGRTNSFGEWEKTYHLEKREPFFLTLRSLQRNNLYSKKVMIDPKVRDKQSNLLIAKKIIIPFNEKQIATKNTEKTAATVKQAYSKIYFYLAKDRLAPKKLNKRLEQKLIPELQQKSRALGLQYTMKASWQIYLEPFTGPKSSSSRKSSTQWIKVVSKLPFSQDKIKFIFRYNWNNSRHSIEKLFTTLRSKIRYPYSVIKKGRKWFVVSPKTEHETLWKSHKKLVLENFQGKNFKVKGKRLKDKAHTLIALEPSRHKPCHSHKEKPCYLYNKVHL